MINYLAALGWNDGTEKEIYTIPELISAFKLERVVKAPSMFDMTKLRWINAQHMKLLSIDQLKRELKPFLLESDLLIDKENMSDRFLEVAVNNSCSKIEVLVDAIPIIEACLSYPITRTLEAGDASTLEIVNDEFELVVKALIDAYDDKTLPTGSEVDFDVKWKEFVKQLGTTLGRKGKRLFHPLRLALTGEMSGPDVGHQIKLIEAAQGQVKHFVNMDERMKVLRQWQETMALKK